MALVLSVEVNTPAIIIGVVACLALAVFAIALPSVARRRKQSLARMVREWSAEYLRLAQEAEARGDIEVLNILHSSIHRKVSAWKLRGKDLEHATKTAQAIDAARGRQMPSEQVL